MNTKRKKNWTEIKARYISGEKPASIAEDFERCTGKMINNKASKESWGEERRIYATETLQTTKEIMRSRIEENANKVVVLESKLIDAQIQILDRGKEFFDYITECIEKHAEEEESHPFARAELVNRLKDMYFSFLGKFIPAPVVVAAFKSAREVAGAVDNEKTLEKFELIIRKGISTDESERAESDSE